MAERVAAIPGRLAGPVQSINVGPSPATTLSTTETSGDFDWTPTGTISEAQNNMAGMMAAWFWPGGVGYIWRWRNSGFGEVGSMQFGLRSGGLWAFFRPVQAGGGSSFFLSSIGAARPTFVRNQWNHVICAWDMRVTPAGFGVHFVLNGSLLPQGHFVTYTVNLGDDVAFNDAVNARFQQSFFDGTFATFKAVNSLYVNDRESLDMTVQSNIDKFIDTTRYTPVQLGPDGSNPTGSAPLILIRPTPASPTNNVGFGPDPVLDGTWDGLGGDPTSPARYAHFTGTSNNSGLSATGAALSLGDTQQFTLSMWFTTALTTTAGFLVIATDNSASNRLVIEYDTSGLLSVTARNSSGTVILNATAATPDIADDAWHHIGISVNMTAATGPDAVRMYVDNNTASPTVNTFVASDNIDLGQTGLSLGFVNSLNHPTLTQGEYSQIWFDVGTFIDFSDNTARANFVGFVTQIFPVDLGTDGSTPTGSVPLVLLGDAPTFIDAAQPHALNRGSGVDFTVDRDPWESPTGSPARSFL